MKLVSLFVLLAAIFLLAGCQGVNPQFGQAVMEDVKADSVPIYTDNGSVPFSAMRAAGSGGGSGMSARTIARVQQSQAFWGAH